MARLVTCMLCNGSKADEKGARCHECAGLGVFPHWSDRTEEDIRRDLGAVARIVRETKDSIDFLECQVDEPGERDPGLTLQLARESLTYWNGMHAERSRELLACLARIKEESATHANP